MLKKLLAPTARRLAPQLYWQRKLQHMQGDFHEPELHLVGLLSDPAKTAIDVGAAAGLFVAHLVKTSRDCLAFEPRPAQAERIEEMVNALRLPVKVERTALSNAPGQATLRILASDAGRSTIEAENLLEDPDGSERLSIDVPVRRLDDYGLKEVGFIKIDVEGHEVAVLEGARETIRRSRCNLLTEVEDRHKPHATATVFELMHGLGYAGFFINDRRLVDVESFDVRTHQDPAHIGGWKSGWARTGTYINNFIWVPSDRRESFRSQAAALVV